MNRVIFQCEDSMEGILTGVYDAWASRVGHDRVKLEAGPDHEMELFSEYRRVETDGEKAEKVAGTIRRRMGQNCWESIYQATLAEEKEKAEAVYRSVVLGLSLAQRKNGSVYRLMENIQEPCIFQVMTLSRTVAREAHRYLGFVRFQEMKGKLLYSEIEPFGQILPLIGDHFANRYPGERFLIFDRHHQMSLLHQPGAPWYLFRGEAPKTELLEQSDGEKAYEELWKRFVDTIAIRERENGGLQQQFLPLKFRKYMTEWG